MSKRLQVVLSDEEFARVQHAAGAERVSLSEWARGALREAAGKRSRTPADEKITAIRRAAGHSFPAPDIGQMLAEIESGYLRDT